MKKLKVVALVTCLLTIGVIEGTTSSLTKAQTNGNKIRKGKSVVFEGIVGCDCTVPQGGCFCQFDQSEPVAPPAN